MRKTQVTEVTRIENDLSGLELNRGGEKQEIRVPRNFWQKMPWYISDLKAAKRIKNEKYQVPDR